MKHYVLYITIDFSQPSQLQAINSMHAEGRMATSNALRVWANTLKEWAASVDADAVRERMIQLAAELDRLAECKEVAERQFV
jgi:hypothetical protein